mmetsp:Transcript_3748/g.9468  ORF Transcript_3748/g.9468 Transcript_3748/m.9468 type:complete len:216 (-) Transcript_3748:1190-1837(-)
MPHSSKNMQLRSPEPSSFLRSSRARGTHRISSFLSANSAASVASLSVGWRRFSFLLTPLAERYVSLRAERTSQNNTCPSEAIVQHCQLCQAPVPSSILMRQPEVISCRCGSHWMSVMPRLCEYSIADRAQGTRCCVWLPVASPSAMLMLTPSAPAAPASPTPAPTPKPEPGLLTSGGSVRSHSTSCPVPTPPKTKLGNEGLKTNVRTSCGASSAN